MASSEDKGKRYRGKRDFRKTPEPRGRSGRSSGRAPLFVVQRHDASTEHYDFRIEVDGVLKSWAVPKGPSTDPREKRLAIPTEDHPLEYADFEGVIPEGSYGAGVVQVWDRGSYRNITGGDDDDGNGNDDTPSVGEALENGHLLIELEGEKLSGGYALHRTGTGGGRGKNANWLLVKMSDDAADARRNPVSTEQRSVKSDRTMTEIEREEDDSSS